MVSKKKLLEEISNPSNILGLEFKEHKKSKIYRLKNYPIILKVDECEKNLKFESEIANIYSNFAKEIGIELSVPNYHQLLNFEDKYYLFIEEISGNNLFENLKKDVGLNSQIKNNLIRDLALWQELFSHKESPISLYRDSMSSNYIFSNDNQYTHIDFGSSSESVHVFDDLSLLLNSTSKDYNTNQTDLDNYFYYRGQFNNLKGRGLKKLENIFNQKINFDSNLKEKYLRKLIEMDFDIDSKKESLKRINFNYLNREDYLFFDNYRKMRIEYYNKEVWKNET